MPMVTPPTLGTNQSDAWPRGTAVVGLGTLVLAVLCAACYKVEDLRRTDGNGEDASLLDDARQSRDAHPDVDGTNDDSAAFPSDDGEPLPASFCSGRKSGETETMAELIYPSDSIAVDEASVYVIADDEESLGYTLWRIEKADGEKRALMTPENVDPGRFAQAAIALDDTHVYVGAREGNLARIAKSGGDPEIYILDEGDISKIAVADRRFFISIATRSPQFTRTFWYGATYTFPQMEVLVEAIDAFRVQDEMVYYVQGDTLWRRPVNGGERVALWGEIDELEYELLVVTKEGIYIYDDIGILRVDAAGGSAEYLWQGFGDGGEGFGFTVEGDDAYWTSATGELWHGSVSSPSEIRMMDRHGPYDDDNLFPAVAVDDDTVYWTAAPDVIIDDGPAVLYRTCR